METNYLHQQNCLCSSLLCLWDVQIHFITIKISIIRIANRFIKPQCSPRHNSCLHTQTNRLIASACIVVFGLLDIVSCTSYSLMFQRSVRFYSIIPWLTKVSQIETCEPRFCSCLFWTSKTYFNQILAEVTHKRAKSTIVCCMFKSMYITVSHLFSAKVTITNNLAGSGIDKHSLGFAPSK